MIRSRKLRAFLAQVALALSQSANDATVTRRRSEDEALAAAKRASLHNVSNCTRAEALSYQYWDTTWYALLTGLRSALKAKLVTP